MNKYIQQSFVIIFFIGFYQSYVYSNEELERAFNYVTSQTKNIQPFSGIIDIIFDDRPEYNYSFDENITFENSLGGIIAEGSYLNNGDFGVVYQIDIKPFRGINYVPLVLKIPIRKNLNKEFPEYNGFQLDVVEVKDYVSQKRYLKDLAIDYRPFFTSYRGIPRGLVLMELYDSTLGDFIIKNRYMRPKPVLKPRIGDAHFRLHFGYLRNQVIAQIPNQYLNSQLQRQLNQLLRGFSHMETLRPKNITLVDLHSNNFLVKTRSDGGLKVVLADAIVMEADRSLCADEFLKGLNKPFKPSGLTGKKVDIDGITLLRCFSLAEP